MRHTGDWHSRSISGLVFATVITLACSGVIAPPADAQPALSDTEITNAIESELLVDNVVPSDRITVETTDGLVTLSGQVDNMLAKERAVAIVRTVRGTRTVVDKIVVAPPMTLSDADIAANVERALLQDPATDSYEVDVSVANGVVFLEGTVDSWQAKRLAETVATSVAGVVGSENKISVTHTTDRDDIEIQREIEQSVAWNALIDHGLIEVDVDGGAVTLTGIVGSAAEKDLARVESWVAGVQSVSTEDLKVERWARDEDLRREKYAAKSDEEIKAALRNAFAHDPRIMPFEITPTVEAGVVTLHGDVDNLRARRAATTVARRTVGVVEIKDELSVAPVVISDDTDLEKNVTDAIARDPIIDPNTLKVSVIDGEAQLSGTVKSYNAKTRADDAASRVAGVISVKNDLIVDNTETWLVYNPYVDQWYPYTFQRPEYQPPYATSETDDAIENAIRQQFYWSPFVDEDDVTVKLENGEARLTGTVESWSESQAAEVNAYEGGAKWVENELAINPQ